MPTAYEILHIPRDAGLDDVKRAYRKAALAYHPDRHPITTKPLAEKSFKEVAQAYAILNDPKRRQTYDRMLNLAECGLKAAPPPTSCNTVTTRTRRNSFSAHPVSIQPPALSVHAGEVDPYRVFNQVWGGRSTSQVFAEQLDNGASSTFRPPPTRSSTTPDPRSRTSQAPISDHYVGSGAPSSHTRGLHRPTSPLTTVKNSSWLPARPLTPGTNGPRAPSRSSTPIAQELSRPRPDLRDGPPSSTPGSQRRVSSMKEYGIQRPSSAYGAPPSSRTRSRPTFSQRSIYDDAEASERDQSGPPIIRPVAIRATSIQSVVQPNGTYHTQRLDAMRVVDRDGVVRDSFRRQRSGLVMDPSEPLPIPVRAGSRAGYEYSHKNVGRPESGYKAVGQSTRRNSFSVSGSGPYR